MDAPLPYHVDLDTCAMEPIHVIGRIQSFGYLMACSSDWIINHVSVNWPDLVPFATAEEMVGRNIIAVFPGDTVHELRSRIQMLSGPNAVERVFGIALFGDDRLFDVAVHRSGKSYVFEAERTEGGRRRDYVSYVRPMIDRIKDAGSVTSLCHMGARMLRGLTGIDRVKIYRFDPSGAGEVIAESRAGGIDSFLGLHFPAADIPAQARQLYKRNLLRIISDIDDPTVPIVPATNPSGEPIDLSMSGLRAVSPIHVEYLRNMGVRASLSVSIMRRGELWGLMACHHYSPLTLPYSVRTAAELFGEIFSYLLEQAETDEAQQHRAGSMRLHDEIMARLASGGSLLSAFDEFADSIAQVIPFDGIAGYVGGTYTARGHTPDAAQFADLARFLNTCGGGAVWASDNLGGIYEPGHAFVDRAAGLLALPVSRIPGDYVVLFRREQIHEVTWAGNPEKSVEYGPNGVRLTPRKSFAEWTEQRRGHSHPWASSEIAAAENLRITLLEVVLQLAEAAQRERERAAQQADTLIAELNHRVRNILNLIRGLVSQSKAGASSIEDFAEILGSRIHALARAHDQVTQSNWSSASLCQLIETEVEAYAEGRDRVEIVGPDALLEPRAFIPLALVFHELTTNSGKYGALSAATGKVTITLLPRPDGALTIHWVESGGPPVAPPTRRGFGSAIIQRSVPHELGGEADVDFAPDGLKVRFLIPGDAMASFQDPAQNGAKPAADGQRPAADPASSALSGTALVLEDNMLIAMEAEDLLRELGCERCEIAGSVDAGLGAIAAERFSFAVLDINLGRETSEPVAHRLVEVGVPFVFASGYGESAQLAASFPGVPVITKPYSGRDLLAAVRRIGGG